MEQAEKVMAADWQNDKAKLANKLAMRTGMRASLELVHKAMKELFADNENDSAESAVKLTPLILSNILDDIRGICPIYSTGVLNES